MVVARKPSVPFSPPPYIVRQRRRRVVIRCRSVCARALQFFFFRFVYFFFFSFLFTQRNICHNGHGHHDPGGGPVRRSATVRPRGSELLQVSFAEFAHVIRQAYLIMRRFFFFYLLYLRVHARQLCSRRVFYQLVPASFGNHNVKNK